MKKIIRLFNRLTIGGLLLMFAACEKDLEVYDSPECRLNFYYEGVYLDADLKESMTEKSYSFIYAGSDVLSDTVWLEAETMGFVSDMDRPYELQQLATGENDALPGVHYVAFDDSDYKTKCLIVPGGQTRFRVPIVVKRDASLEEEDVVLCVAFKENDLFKPGYEKFQVRRLTISGKLSKPSNWEEINDDTWLCVYWYFGDYGPVKHQFLIDETGEKWDDEYIANLISGDSGYFTYLYTKLANRLVEVNAEREATGWGVLCEKDGTPVEF